jgi:ABC-type amino acid transport substrate-binding protein
MRFFVAVLFVTSITCLSAHGRSLASIRKDAFTVGVSKGDSAAEYDFISAVTAKMKFSRFRLVPFENANAGQKMLLDGKIDAIIAKVNYSSHLENRFLVSAPYGKTEIAVAKIEKNSEIWTLADLNGKALAFIPKDISGEQIQNIWQNSKPQATQNLKNALNFLQKGQALAVVANRQALEAEKDSTLRIFPNKLMENNLVALFAPNSKNLLEEFNATIKHPEIPGSNKRIDKILNLLNELKKELELLQGELK